MTVEYRIDDALSVVEDLPDGSVQLIHLDDAWARPKRNGGFGVEYPTHPFDDEAAEKVAGEPGVTDSLTVVDLLDACWTALAPGGVLVVDTDDYLLPHVLTHATAEYGEHSHVVANVTALNSRGEPDRSTPGMYFSTGGYAAVHLWKDACPIPSFHPLHTNYPARAAVPRQRENYGWGSAKPLFPYEVWVREFTTAGDLIVVPCAGTAPTAIAAELVYGDDADVLCIDIEEDAKAAYERRRDDELDRQETLAGWPR